MKNWWKYLSVLLLLYVIYDALHTPLGPGLLSPPNSQLHTGRNSAVIVAGYNTDFNLTNPSFPKPLVWLVSDTSIIPGTLDKVLGKNELGCTFDIPDTLPSPSLDLHVQYPEGHFKLANAFHVVGAATGALSASSSVEIKNATYSDPGRVFPNREILNESIRNLMFHVPMWFSMMLVMTIAMVYSIKYLRTFDMKYDLIAREAVKVGLLLGILGLATGSLWARFTWTQWWVNDTKLNGAAITTLIYLAYNILRGSINEEQNKARIAAVYNIFAYVILIVMLMILPRITDNLHPGNGGNPAFSKYDLDSALRMVFYPAVLGWMGISLWMMQIRIRTARIIEKTEKHEAN